MNLNDAVAIVGVHPFSKSPNRNAARKLPHNTDDLVVAHNIGTDRECEVRLTKSGDIKTTSQALRVGAESTIVSGEMSASGGLSVKGNLGAKSGATGSFTSSTGQIVTVANGIIIGIT